MSEQDNVATVRRAYDAFRRGDIAAVLDSLADDIEWTSPTVPGIPFGGVSRGKAAVADYFRQMAEAEEVLEFEPREFIAQGDRVVVIGHYRGRVKATGRTGESPWIHIFTLRNGKATRFFELYDTAAAARAYQKTTSA